MSKRFILTIVTLLVIASAAGVAIFLAKGYTFSPKERKILGTGILTIASIPDSASVFLDGRLTTATNTTIASLSPKNYDVRVVKEGFIPWEKQVAVKTGLVTELKITLFPAIPTIYPLTFNGVQDPTLSPDGQKLAYIVPTGKKAGIWVWTQGSNQPISFARTAEPHQIAQSINIDFSKADLKWSADSKQVVAVVGGNNYLLEAEKMNSEPRDITAILPATLQNWDDDSRSKETSRILAVKKVTLRRIASESALVRWSPDETKFMAGADEKSLKVYDTEDGKDYQLPEALSLIWLPDSRHIILVEEKTISIADYDGSNKAVIYAGSFQNSFVFPWPDSSRLVIISSSPTPTASEPNLYGINLK